MKCFKCGYALPDDSEFCQYCGVKLETEPEQSNAAYAVPKLIIEPQPFEPEAPRIGTVKDLPESGKDHADATLSAEGTGNIPQEEAKSGGKQRYCKFCGGAIHPKTRKCQSCGKQYFRVPKCSGTVLLAVICLVLVGLNVFQYTRAVLMEEKLEQVAVTISTNELTISKQEKIISNQRETISNQKSKISGLTKDVALYKDKAEFMDYCVVFIGSSNNRYHKYGCEDLDLRHPFYVYNPENAQAQGYRACNKCN